MNRLFSRLLQAPLLVVVLAAGSNAWAQLDSDEDAISEEDGSQDDEDSEPSDEDDSDFDDDETEFAEDGAEEPEDELTEPAENADSDAVEAAAAAPDEPAANDRLASKPRRRHNWLGVSVRQDLAYIQSERDVCSQTAQTSGRWTCLRQETQTQYHGTPLVGAGGSIPSSGFDLATTRLLLSYDRVFGAHFTLGARVGWVVRGRGPRPDGAESQDFLVWHAEGRVAYWFGNDPFARKGFRPYVFGLGGIAQLDTEFDVRVVEDQSVPDPPHQLGNPPEQILDAWHRSGRGLLGLGAGLVYAITPAVGVSVEASWLQLVPTAGVALGLDAGLVFGF